LLRLREASTQQEFQENEMNDPSEWVKTTKDADDYDRHRQERAENGFSVFDWWSFCDYMAWVNIQALEKFKDGAGFPADLHSMDEWKSELDTMIAGFKAYQTLSALDYDFRDKAETDKILKTQDDGLALYAKRFSALWD
jgi:hypothetical protein